MATIPLALICCLASFTRGDSRICKKGFLLNTIKGGFNNVAAYQGEGAGGGCAPSRAKRGKKKWAFLSTEVAIKLFMK